MQAFSISGENGVGRRDYTGVSRRYCTSSENGVQSKRKIEAVRKMHRSAISQAMQVKNDAN